MEPLTILPPHKTNHAFWSLRDRYGVYHSANKHDPRYRPDMLLIFVHGLFGDCIGTWTVLPELIMRVAGIEAECLSFSYNTLPWAAASISAAATDLQTLLRARYLPKEPPYKSAVDRGIRHIVIITHSAGGLVAEEMLNQSFSSLIDEGVDALPAIDNSQYTFLRVRKLVNIAVPHMGASTSLSVVLSILYHLFFLLAFPVLYLVKFVSQRSLDWGYNSFAIELARWSRKLRKLSAAFTHGRTWAFERDLPVPAVSEILARADAAVPVETITDVNPRGAHSEFAAALANEGRAESRKELARSVTSFRGNHSGVKIPESEHDLIIDYISEILQPFRDATSILIAERSVSRGFDLDRQSHVKGLLTLADTSAVPMARTEYAPTLLAQRAAYLRLKSMIADSGTNRSTIVVSGIAGVGKSTALRRLTSTEASSYMRRRSAAATLTIFVPLQQFTLPKRDFAVGISARTSYNGRTLLEDIMLAWTGWVSARLTYPGAVSMDWVTDRLLNRNSILILDGLDEFLVSNPHVRITDISDMIHWLVGARAEGAEIRVILGVRNSVPGYAGLASGAGMLIEIPRLAKNDAVVLYPSLRPVLEAIREQDVEQLLLTPLILSRLENEPSLALQNTLRTPSDLIMLALASTLRGGSVGQTPEFRADPVEPWIEALSIIGWIYFELAVNDLSTESLAAEVRSVPLKWTAAANGSRPDDAFLAALDLLNDERNHDVLFRSVFFATGPHNYRFQNRMWQDYLAARYLAHTFRFGRYELFGNIGCNNSIFRIAGEVLGPLELSPATVAAVYSAERETRKPFISGNFCGILANSILRLSGPAIGALMHHLDIMSPIGRIVFFNGISRRILANRARDDAAPALRRAILPKLQTEAARQIGEATSVTASIAWCYLQAFARKFGTVEPPAEWCVHLGAEPTHELDALSLICDSTKLPYATNRAHESIQAAFLEILPLVLSDDASAISVTHYLFFLVVASHNNVQLASVGKDLQTIFGRDPAILKSIEAYDLVPELGEIVQKMKRMYLGVSPH
jgi:hypothetical protein